MIFILKTILKKRWFFQFFSKTKTNIQEQYYEFMKTYAFHIIFFEWFSFYVLENYIDCHFLNKICIYI